MTQYKKYRNNLSFSNKVARFVWNLWWLILFRPFSLPIFNSYRIFTLRLFGCQVGHGCKVNSRVKIWAPWNLKIGDLVAIGFDVLIYNPGRITIGSKVSISQRAHLCSASHNIYSTANELITREIEINDRAWIATDAYIGPGVVVGEGAVVAARAVIVKNVAPWNVVGGNPAQFIKIRKIIK